MTTITLSKPKAKQDDFIHPEDAVTGAQAALATLYDEFWSEVTENPDPIHQECLAEIAAKCEALKKDIGSMIAGVCEEADARARRRRAM